MAITSALSPASVRSIRMIEKTPIGRDLWTWALRPADPRLGRGGGSVGPCVRLSGSGALSALRGIEGALVADAQKEFQAQGARDRNWPLRRCYRAEKVSMGKLVVAGAGKWAVTDV